MQPLPHAQRHDLRALRAAATGGQWVRIENIHAESTIVVAGFERTRRIAELITSPADYGRANANYIVASTNALPEVLDALDEMESDRDQWRTRALTAEGLLQAAQSR